MEDAVPVQAAWAVQLTGPLNQKHVLPVNSLPRDAEETRTRVPLSQAQRDRDDVPQG